VQTAGWRKCEHPENKKNHITDDDLLQSLAGSA
jgi:hypothetical protein